jgi:hypothetical protein
LFDNSGPCLHPDLLRQGRRQRRTCQRVIFFGSKLGPRSCLSQHRHFSLCHGLPFIGSLPRPWPNLVRN